CTFSERPDFLVATFDKPSSFWKTKFAAGAGFVTTHFIGKANFRHAEFEGRADFVGASFQEETDFGVARFESQANFRGCKFQGDAGFQSAAFRAEAEFTGSTFESRTSLCDVVFEDALLVGVEGNERKSFTKTVDFTRVKLSKPQKVEFRKVDLSQFRFLETDLREVHFTDVGWYRKNGRGRNRVFDEIYRDSTTKKPDYCLVAHLYRRLRANFERTLLYPEAGDFYIGEMEMTRKAEKSVLKKLPLLFYNAISNYGESYYRSLCWIGAMLVIFPMLFMLAGIEPTALDRGYLAEGIINYRLDFSTNESILPTLEDWRAYRTSALYSASIFFLVRDKKFTTINNWGRLLFVLESILSPVTLAFFLLALRRRFKR
ncbi:MAG: pentapeptide repeat-containing protein, partial [Candidatus Zixiibacteriota bacterium]